MASGAGKLGGTAELCETHDDTLRKSTDWTTRMDESLSYWRAHTWEIRSQTTSALAPDECAVAVGAVVCPVKLVQEVRTALESQRWLKKRGTNVSKFVCSQPRAAACRAAALKNWQRRLETCPTAPVHALKAWEELPCWSRVHPITGRYYQRLHSQGEVEHSDRQNGGSLQGGEEDGSNLPLRQRQEEDAEAEGHGDGSLGELMAVHANPAGAMALNRAVVVAIAIEQPAPDLDGLRGESSLPPSLTHLLRSGQAEWVPDLRVGSRECVHKGSGPPPLPQAADAADPPSPAAAFRFCELFCGIGGFRLGLEAVGGRCVFACDVDQQAARTYVDNFGACPSLHGDITEVESCDVPGHDVLCAGWPCQPFSKAGAQPGFGDTDHGHLFFEIVRVARAARPAVVFLENVANVIKVEQGRVLSTVLHELRKAGYLPHHTVINARAVLPQQRERLYIVAFRADLTSAHAAFRWPTLRPVPTTVRDILQEDYEQEYVLTEHQHNRIHSSRDYMEEPQHRLVRIHGGARTLMASYKHSYHLYSEFVPISLPSTDTGTQQTVAGPASMRFFTPRECARLMGFPESFVLPSQPSAKNHFYHHCGNAVCPPVIAAITGAVLAALSLEDADICTGCPSADSTASMVQLLMSATPRPERLASSLRRAGYAIAS